MPIELLRIDAVKLLETMFSITPEALNAVDMMRAAHKFALPVINSKVFGVAHICQAVVTAPSLRVDHRFGRDRE